MRSIDLNCDLGESFGAWQMGDDNAVMPHVSSINIACGFHAGDPLTMKRTVDRAVDLGVAIGAHPGLPDKVGFGRRAIAISPSELYADTLYQIGALAAFVVARGARLQHVKPHGALYHMLEQKLDLAQAFSAAVLAFDRRLQLVGLSGGQLVAVGAAAGLSVAHEVFADRRYLANGQLVPRGQTGAVIDTPSAAAMQLGQLLTEGRVCAIDGEWVALRADTVCLHGDRADAAAFAQQLNNELTVAGYQIRALGVSA
jgi:5-oxoprolinase (ATP-hydrolysing) subunit A